MGSLSKSLQQTEEDTFIVCFFTLFLTLIQLFYMGLCFLVCSCKLFTCKLVGPLFDSVLMSFELALSPGRGTCGLGPCTGSAK